MIEFEHKPNLCVSIVALSFMAFSAFILSMQGLKERYFQWAETLEIFQERLPGSENFLIQSQWQENTSSNGHVLIVSATTTIKVNIFMKNKSIFST